ncbi:hypothetical protein ACFQZS_17475 [Mucilaginibacter calamicampi]|uniref:SnoaL-like domain-containing protein n=1 Tax=Mucilaginibacter calamicampi TaxID=1302352 RepID=A0ABW2Z1K2_9SPHI
MAYYLDHLAGKDLYASFPGGGKPLASHADFTQWYNNLLTQTKWNFHDIGNIQVKRTANNEFLVTFIVNWYGEVKADSPQLAGWQSRKDSYLYHYTLRQVWNVSSDESTHNIVIKRLVVSSGDTPSPIND